MKTIHILGNFFSVFTDTSKHLIYLETQSLCVRVRHWEEVIIFMRLYC